MKYRKLDSNGDMITGSGSNDFFTGRDAVGQAVATRLKLLYSEWWEDITDGLPLWQDILGRRTPKDKIDAIYTARILGTQGVIGIQSFSSSFVNRQYSFQANVNTTYGTVAAGG